MKEASLTKSSVPLLRERLSRTAGTSAAYAFILWGVTLSQRIDMVSLGRSAS